MFVSLSDKHEFLPGQLYSYLTSDTLILEGISTTSTPMSAISRQWYRQYFYDHPELQRSSLSAFVNVKEKRAKAAYTELCFDTRVTAERERDEDELKMVYDSSFEAKRRSSND